MNTSGQNEQSHFFLDNDEKFDDVYKDEETQEINPNLESLQYLSTTYLSKNHPITEEDGQNTQEQDIDETHESGDENDDDYNSDSNDEYFDNLSSININDSQSMSMFSNNDTFSKISNQKATMSKPEQLKMIYMRSFLDKIENSFKDKDQATKNIHLEIIECKQRIDVLEKRRDDIYEQLNTAQSEGNITVAKRLNAEHENICQEIDLETHVLSKLKEAHDNSNYERGKALLEKTKYAMAESDLKLQEDSVNKQKEIKAQMRIMNEEKKVEAFKMTLEKQKLEEKERVLEENLRQKKTIEKARISRQITNKYLNQTIRELNHKKEMEKKSFNEEFEFKKKDLLNLKQTIDHNREIFQAKVNKKKYQEAKEKQMFIEETKNILERGENPNFFIPRQKKMDEAERAKKKFEQQQFKNTQDIVKKILGEQENLEKKKRLYPNLFNINLKPLPKVPNKDEQQNHELNLLSKIAGKLGYEEENLNYIEEKEPEDEMEEIHERRSIIDSTTIASKDDDDDSDIDELNDQEDCLVKPEFEGLWDSKPKKYDANDFYKKQVKFPTCFKSKTEKDLYIKTLGQLKKSAVRDQVVAGRKFNGVSFKSNPKVVHFKDFKIGESYSMKVVLTNISYSINTCKLLDITEKLKDFIKIDFQPPGQLSAGLTCEFNVRFEPKINKDLEGELQFLASNGPFSIPLKCTIKKCDLSVNTNSIYFGTIVIGEELNRKVQLINKGALGTNFKLISNKDLIAQESFRAPDSEINSFNTQQDENQAEGIRMGNVTAGYIAPFQTIELEFFFATSFPGKFQENFTIQFDDEDSKELNIVSKATAIDVPIWIENLNIDLKICMYDRLYQEVIRVHNRASAALRITFEVPNELKNHLEILPKTAFIQAKSEFSAQVKFTAKNSLKIDAEKYFDVDTGVLELPLHIKVADQNKTVQYNLHAIITTSDLEFNTKEIDFGYCTIYETARATVNLTNHSILCQPFGFVKLQDYVNVQPNDGFGTLLPNETIPIDINFCPKSAKEFKFTVVCKSLVNREFVINCKGIGVHPPLKLSAQRINFKATSLNSSSFQTIHVHNDHVDYDQHRHPVPRIGAGEIAKVGLTSFEFDLPESCPFKLSPSVGQVAPGQKVKVTLQYTAKLDEKIIKQNAMKVMKKRLADAATKAPEPTPLTAITETVEVDVKSKKKAPTSKAKGTTDRNSLSSSMSIRNEIKTPDIENIDHAGQDYVAGLNLSMENYEGGFEHFQIPCYVSTSQESYDPSQNVSYSIHNTLYLDVICPSVRPEIITLTNPATRVIDFGKTSIGHKCIQKITIKNISNSIVELKNTLFDTDGPFVLLNSLKPIQPGSIYNLIVAFIPTKSLIFRENFEIRTENSNLNFVFTAIGVEPSFSLSFDGYIHDFGYCFPNERAEKTIEMKNNSNVPISFKISLDSSNEDLRRENEKKRCLNSNDMKFRPPIGPNNHSGLSSFDVYPLQGEILAGSKLDFKVVFSPDHASELFSDTLRISLISTDKNSRTIQLYGKSRKSNMFIKGVENIKANSNSESVILTDIDPNLLIDADAAAPVPVDKNAAVAKAPVEPETPLPIPIPIVLSLYSIASSKTFGEYSQAEKTIQIGAMKSPPTKDGKKSGEFFFENLKDINAKGFNVELAKSAVEYGGERSVKVTWKPPQGIDVKQTVQTSILLTTKANITETWRLVLQGRVVSESFHVS